MTVRRGVARPDWTTQSVVPPVPMAVLCVPLGTLTCISDRHQASRARHPGGTAWTVKPQRRGGQGSVPQGRQGLAGFRGGGQRMVMECLSAKARELDVCVVFCIYILS